MARARWRRGRSKAPSSSRHHPCPPLATGTSFDVALPMLSTVLKLIEGSPDASYIKKCFGIEHQNFLVKTSSLIGLKSKFWESDINDGIVSIDDLILIGKKICKIAETILFFILAANVTEGILYYQIFSHMTR